MKTAEYLVDGAIMTIRGGLAKRDEAAEILAEVIRQDPAHADAWSLRARLEAEAGRPFNAMLHHNFATQWAPNRHDLWCNRGIDAMDARMFAESRTPSDSDSSYRA